MIALFFQIHRERLNICGDIHGQFFDLLNIFENVTGFPSETNKYLFNGDFVDRGVWSVEVMIVLLGFKLLLPGKFMGYLFIFTLCYFYIKQMFIWLITITTYLTTDYFFLVRGNHEAAEVNRVYGFENEVKIIQKLEKLEYF